MTKSANKEPNQASEEEAALTASIREAEPFDYVLMALGMAGGIGTGLTIPGMSILFGLVMDDFNEDPSVIQEKIATLSLSFAGLAAFSVISGFFQVYFWTLTGERQTQKFRSKYVKSILSQEMAWFDQRNTTELSTEVSDVLYKVEDGISRKMGELTQFFAQILSCLIVAFYFEWRLTLVLLGTMPIMGAAGAFMISAVNTAQNQSMEQYGAAGGVVNECLHNIRTVCSLNAQRHFLKKYRAYISEAMHIGIVKGLKVGFATGCMFGAYLCVYALGFWFGGYLIAEDLRHCTHNCLSGGTIITVFLSVTIASEALGQISPPLLGISTARVAVKHVMNMMQRVPQIDSMSHEGKGLHTHIGQSSSITFSSVSFAYPARKEILVSKDLSFKIKPGETVAFVGPSGSGKSTIINLLLRFYDPARGTICIDSTDIRRINIRSLRRYIGYVGQEPVLFRGSIYDNIVSGYASKDWEIDGVTVSDEELRLKVISAAQAAHAHDFITSFPQGYDTVLSNGGGELSGGQKQRIAIARALLRNPSILLLDEATSALDSLSEKAVQQTIDDLTKGRAQTTIVIAHRLSSVRNVDRIFVLDGQGGIGEVGSHDDLVNVPDGLYNGLMRAQMAIPVDDKGEEGKVVETGAQEGAITSEVVEKDADAAPGGQELLNRVSEKKEEAQVMSRLLSLLFQHPILLTLGLLGGLVFGATFAIWGYLLAKAQTAFYYSTPEKVLEESRFYAYLFVLVGGVALISATLQYYGVCAAGERLVCHLRYDTLKSILRHPPSFFDLSPHTPSQLSTLLSRESHSVHKAFGEGGARVLQALGSLFGGLAVALSASYILSLLTLATFPIIAMGGAVQMQAMTGQQYETGGNGKDDKVGMETGESLLHSVFINMRTLSSLHLQPSLSSRYDSLTLHKSLIKRQRGLFVSLAFGFSNAALFLSLALLFWYAGDMVVRGEITFSQLLISIMGLIMAAFGLGHAVQDLGDQKTALQAAQLIFNIQDMKCEVDGLDRSKGQAFRSLERSIVLNNITFVYPARPESTVCEGLDVEVKKGETVALVGPSGSGKSTMINLLLRFYNPSGGAITIDDVNMQDYNVMSLREGVGYVGQEPVLFRGSVKDNILLGTNDEIDEGAMGQDEESVWSDICLALGVWGSSYTPVHRNAQREEADVELGKIDASLQQVISAAQAAHAHDFITSFPQGYDTVLSNGGGELSGGQKQRIAIARALLRNPSILLLDEATSALDTQSERSVQQTIEALTSQSDKLTTIIVAHRLTSIKNVDHIYVFDGRGKIGEVGSHAELLSREGGLYAKLWRQQQGEKK